MIAGSAMASTFNLGNLLVGIGLIGLGGTFFLPTWSADRVVRVEGRAEALARALLAGAAGMEPLDLADPQQIAKLAADLALRYQSFGFPESDLPELVAGPPPTATFQSRHYLLRVVRQPAEAGVDPLADTVRPLAVYAWPRSVLPPGRTVFFMPADGIAAYSRNLAADYAGLDHAPPPGAALPADPAEAQHQATYRSRDNEHWIKLPWAVSEAAAKAEAKPR